MTSTTIPIRLAPDLCQDIIEAFDSTLWAAPQDEGEPRGEQWDDDVLKFHIASLWATLAIDEEAGRINGDKVADSLEIMATLEKKWGTDTQTDKLRIEIARILNWDTTSSDLLAMLWAGGE